MDDFEAFVRARSNALARSAYLLTGDRHLAEDLLQDALARVALRWPAVVRQGDPEPYVRRVLYSCAVDGWRRRLRWRRVERAAAGRLPEPRRVDDDSEAVTRRLVLRDALARLTLRQRAVLILRFYEDLTESQAAEVLGCSTNTVKSQTRHALARLRDDEGDWYAVAVGGQRWRLPADGAVAGNLPTPTLSPDGRRIGYQPGFNGPYLVHDLVTGQVTRYPQFARSKPDSSFFVHDAPAGRWSADGTRLAMAADRLGRVAGEIRASTAGAVVLDPGGTVTFTTQPSADRLGLAGWVDGDTLLWLSVTGSVAGAVTPVGGAARRWVPMLASPPWQGQITESGVGPVSPDGTSLLVREDGPGEHWLRRFSLSDGVQSGEPVRVPGWFTPCESGWAGSTPAIALYDKGRTAAGTGLLVEGAVRPVLVVEPDLHSDCLVWASDALAGPAHPTPFGIHTWSGFWWWREPLAAIVVLIGLWLIKAWAERRAWAGVERENLRWRRRR